MLFCVEWEFFSEDDLESDFFYISRYCCLLICRLQYQLAYQRYELCYQELMTFIETHFSQQQQSYPHIQQQLIETVDSHHSPSSQLQLPSINLHTASVADQQYLQLMGLLL